MLDLCRRGPVESFRYLGIPGLHNVGILVWRVKPSKKNTGLLRDKPFGTDGRLSKVWFLFGSLASISRYSKRIPVTNCMNTQSTIYVLKSKLLASPLITPVILPYMTPTYDPVLGSLDYSFSGLAITENG